jgi:hypothetical protein
MKSTLCEVDFFVGIFMLDGAKRGYLWYNG